jgi:hypothetical protein
MSVVRDAEDFTRVHAVCGGLTGDADPPTLRGDKTPQTFVCGLFSVREMALLLTLDRL